MHKIYRLFKNTVWYFIITLLGIAFYEFVPLGGAWLWLGLFIFAGIEWVVISKLRERLHF
ncbi:hypothetical protein ANRL1_02872 [Anaerolineae bacterium]|nr:hypothetical protein ANRL1_02872 [Anaerolineae bacterium]